MQLQQRVAAEISAGMVGRRTRVLVDAPLVARTQGDAPEVDGRILLSGPAVVGEFLDVEIDGTQVYDLTAHAARAAQPARPDAETLARV
jgi:ribosomal protein S12 methylthiotransferase